MTTKQPQGQYPVTITHNGVRFKEQACHDCAPHWGRDNNLKHIILCDLHASVKDILAALEAVVKVSNAANQDHTNPDLQRFAARVGSLAKAALLLARKGR